MSDKPYFDGIKVGDKVYSMAYGWGVVCHLWARGLYPLGIKFTSGKDTYTLDGEQYLGELQTLFWDKPEFTPPPRPKRKVKKLVERWMNVHHVDGKTSFSRGCDTKEEADAFEEANIRNGRNRRIACVKLTGEYEVEE